LRFGFLVGRFSHAYWWFEAAVMARKLAVVLCMTFFFTQEGKAQAAVLALAGCLCHLVYARPYIMPLHNTIAVIVLAATSVVLYAGTFTDVTFRRGGVISGICVNIIVLVGGNIVDLWMMSKAEAKAESEFYDDNVFSMDQGPAAVGGLNRASMALDVRMDDLGEFDSTPSFATANMTASDGGEV
ncbi:MAG: hypothetical protein GY809_18255, partial [Planctomycetes bacterium]|nr:hypothetical protein [Planctomycetota bacterium]